MDACVNTSRIDLLIGGGVAASGRLRALLAERAGEQGISLRLRPNLCTDNGAMIAVLGAEIIAAGGKPSALDIGPTHHFPSARSLSRTRLPFGLTEDALDETMSEEDLSRWQLPRGCVPVTPDLAAAALTQASLRRQARAKFGDAAAELFFTRAGLEQATRPEVADHHMSGGSSKPEFGGWSISAAASAPTPWRSFELVWTLSRWMSIQRQRPSPRRTSSAVQR